jgi:translocation protein SEC63
LNDAFAVITQAFGNTEPLVSSFHTSQRLIQAIAPEGSQLLQLPHFNAAVVRAIEGGKHRTRMTLREYMSISPDKRKKLTVGPGLLTARQYQTAMVTAAQLPAVKIEKAFFKVIGERFVTPNSLVQLILKFRFVPLGATNLPAVTEKDLEEPDTDETDDQERFAPPLAHAPFFARDHSPV